MENITIATQSEACGELLFWYWNARYGSVEVFGRHDQDDQIQFLHDGNEDQHEAGNEAALGQGEHNA